MPYCPKCKAKYREGFKVCHYCDVELVDELPPEKKSEEQMQKDSIVKDKPQPELKNEVPLTTVNEQGKYTYITSELERRNIPYRVMEQGVGQYLTIYFGSSCMGQTIYVEKKDYMDALNIVYSYRG